MAWETAAPSTYPSLPSISVRPSPSGFPPYPHGQQGYESFFAPAWNQDARPPESFQHGIKSSQIIRQQPLDVENKQPLMDLLSSTDNSRPVSHSKSHVTSRRQSPPLPGLSAQNGPEGSSAHIWDSSLAPHSGSTNVGRVPESRSAKVDRLILQLKTEDPNMPWSAVASRVQATLNVTYQIPALQMRYRRLSLKQKAETGVHDDKILRQAVRDWEKNKWAIVSKRMDELGADSTWTPRDCERKWLMLELERLPGGIENGIIGNDSNAEGDGDSSGLKADVVRSK